MSLLGDDVVVRSVEGALESGEDPSPVCRNCGARLHGPFCAQCGQKAGSLHVGLGEFAREALDNVISFDSRVWRTLRPLALRPGFLTTEYLAGRRARYVPPLRLYLFISFVVFVSQSWLGDASTVVQFNGGLAEGMSDGEIVVVGPGAHAGSSEDVESPDLGPGAGRPGAGASAEEGDTADSLAESVGGSPGEAHSGHEDSRVDAVGGPASPRDIAQQFSDENLADTPGPVRWFLQRVVQRAVEDPDRFGAEFMRRLPWAFFLLVPGFAVLLRVFYRRIERYYVPHLVVALHFHCFAFFFVLVGNLIDWTTGTGIGSVVTLIAMGGGLLTTLRRVYGQGWIRTVIKAGILVFVHTMALSFAMVVLVLLTGVSLSS